jgi:hypothetical protein
MPNFPLNKLHPGKSRAILLPGCAKTLSKVRQPNMMALIPVPVDQALSHGGLQRLLEAHPGAVDV